LPTQVAPYTRG